MENHFSDQKPISPRRLPSLRLIGADYSEPGAYFITICTKNRCSLFGSVENGQMICNLFGKVVWNTWKRLPKRFPNIEIDTAIVMPDHFHGIIVINDYQTTVGEVHEPPLLLPLQSRRVMTIPLVVGYLKMTSAKEINLMRKTQGNPVWQRNYYDRIIMNDNEYAEISEYILSNPERWGIDSKQSKDVVSKKS